jgi:PPP family 3-phenylpropionic acid transporter
MLDHSKMQQDLNTGGCGAWARLRSSWARFWLGAGVYGLSAIIWLSASALLAIPFAAILVPAFASGALSEARHEERPHHPWLTLLRQRAFVRVTLVAALVLGSHAMYDSFAVIRWRQAGISPATIGMLWSESVIGEVLVFLLIGATLLRVLNPAGFWPQQPRQSMVLLVLAAPPLF